MSLPERVTRKRLIDTALARAGWTLTLPCDEHTPHDLVDFEKHPTALDALLPSILDQAFTGEL